MKITLNNISGTNNYPYYNHTLKKTVSCDVKNYTSYPEQILTSANFPNISFKSSSEAQLLLKYNGILNCAYTGKPMMYNSDFKKLFAKMSKRPNAQAAINLLNGYRKYMYDIESEIFDIFMDSDHKNKKTFTDILKEYAPSSEVKLKEKQLRILSSTNYIIDRLSPETAELVNFILDKSRSKIEDGSFTRSYPLDLIRNIKGKDQDIKELESIYHAWYKLPRSSRDADAFIVSFAKQPHEAIAKRLLTPSIATIEHIKPQSKGGIDSMRNYLLVCRRSNGERSSLPLDEYIMLNPELRIPKHLQEYVEEVIRAVGVKNSLMSAKSWYPKAIQEALLEETSGYINLDLSNLRLTKDQIKENDSPKKLSKKYKVIKD